MDARRVAKRARGTGGFADDVHCTIEPGQYIDHACFDSFSAGCSESSGGEVPFVGTDGRRGFDRCLKYSDYLSIVP